MAVREEKRIYHRKSYEAQKKKLRKYHLKKTYGLSLEGYDSMVLSQEGKCRICGTVPSIQLSVDHCHVAKKVRDLLCQACNLGVGNFKESSAAMRTAADYIDAWNERFKK